MLSKRLRVGRREGRETLSVNKALKETHRNVGGLKRGKVIVSQVTTILELASGTGMTLSLLLLLLLLSSEGREVYEMECRWIVGRLINRPVAAE